MDGRDGVQMRMGGSEQTSLETIDCTHMHIPGSGIAQCLGSAQAVTNVHDMN